MGNLVAYDDKGNKIDSFNNTVTTLVPDLDDKVSIGEPIKFKKQEEVTLSAKMNSTGFYALIWMIEQKMIKNILTPKNIFHNRKTAETIVLWKDGTKTVVKPMEGTPECEMSSYSAFTAALAKRIFGSNTQVNKIVSMTNEPVSKSEVRKLAKHMLDKASELKEKENFEHLREFMGYDKS